MLLCDKLNANYHTDLAYILRIDPTTFNQRVLPDWEDVEYRPLLCRLEDFSTMVLLRTGQTQNCFNHILNHQRMFRSATTCAIVSQYGGPLKFEVCANAKMVLKDCKRHNSWFLLTLAEEQAFMYEVRHKVGNTMAVL
jgi:hypothetical protein